MTTGQKVQMPLPAKTETKKERKLMERAALSVKRARKLITKFKKAPPAKGDKKLRDSVRRSAKKIKAAVKETEDLADVWTERIEMDDE